MTATASTVAAVLKTLYDTREIQDLSISKDPFFAMMSKDTSFTGDGLKIPLAIADPNGRSATFTNAQANIAGANWKAFTLTRATDYAIGRITGEVMEIAQSNTGAFLNAVKLEVQKATQAAMRSAAIKVHRTNVGTICQIQSGTSSPITIRREDAAYFEVGNLIGAVSDETGSGTQRSGVGTITAINRAASATTATITYSGTITSLAATDYLFIDGDYNASFAGFEAWVPQSAPGATAFFGVARNTDTDRLGGLRHTVSGATIEEGLLDALTFAGIAGAPIDKGFLNPTDYNGLIKNLGSRAVYDTTQINARVGFKGVMIQGGTGDVTIYSSPFVPKGRAHLATMSSWKCNSAGKAPHILDYGMGNGNMIVVSNADSVEFRLGWRGNFSCNAPGHNMTVIFS